MADVRLLAVGQKMPSWVQDGCAEYLPRFRHQFQLVVEEITASKKTVPTRERSTASDSLIDSKVMIF